MFESLNLYWKTFMHPWADREETRKISYVEVMGISWVFHFIYTFYSVLAIYLGVKSYEYFSSSDDFTHLMLDSVNFSFQKISLFIQLSTAVFYPILFHFTYKFWTYLLNFYSEIFEAREDFENNSADIVNAMYTSNVFLILPIAGSFFSFVAQVYFLYRGVIAKLHFTKTQAILVLMTPLFLIFIIAILIVSYFFFLFSLL